MLKLLLIGFGLMLLIEGCLYGLFPNKMKNLMRVIQDYDDQKIRNTAIPFCLIGFCLIYFRQVNAILLRFSLGFLHYIFSQGKCNFVTIFVWVFSQHFLVQGEDYPA